MGMGMGMGMGTGRNLNRPGSPGLNGITWHSSSEMKR